jgi:hypothetical protein
MFRLPQILLISCLILLKPLCAQQDGFLIEGYIWDSETGAPLENVNIVVKNTNQGVSTDALGFFLIRLYKLPFTLEISYVGYETKSITYEGMPLRSLRISLDPSSTPLPEVIITSQRIDTLYADRVYSVMDYALTEKGVLLLIYKARLSRSELLLQDYDRNRLLELKVLPMKPLRLYTDCLGEVHIHSMKKAYQLALQESSIEIYKPYGIDYFIEVMAGCRFHLQNKVYFEVFEIMGLVKKFYAVSKLDTTSTLIAVAADEEKLAFLGANPENSVFMNERETEQEMLSSLSGTPSDFQTLGQIRDLSVTLRFNRMAYLSRIYAPIFNLGDTVVIFNHPAGNIEFYNTNDSLIGKTAIRYHLNPEQDSVPEFMFSLVNVSKWKEKVLVDKKQNRAYTLFHRINGTLDLYEINLSTGNTAYRLNIPFPYVQKIQIQDGYLYYIYKGFGEGQRKKLFRQRLAGR